MRNEIGNHGHEGVCLSDTHNRHAELEDLPEADVVVHAGDATETGSLAECESFFAWFSAQPHRTKIFVPGNHDGAAFSTARIRAQLNKKYPDIRVLIDEEYWLDGIRIYGAPWLPAWITETSHFWLRARSRLLEEKWNAIPDDTTLLVTHGPPYGILDKNESGQYIGDSVLLDRIRHLPMLRAHVFGHVHRSSGVLERPGRLSINASICERHGRASNQPVLLEMNSGSTRIC